MDAPERRDFPSRGFLLVNSLGLFFLALFIWVYRELDGKDLIVPFLPLFLAAGALAFIRPGFRVDARQRTVCRYWGFHLWLVDIPFTGRIIRFEDIEAVALYSEVQGMRGGSRRTVHPVELVTRTGIVRVEDPIAESAAIEDAGILSRMLGVRVLHEVPAARP